MADYSKILEHLKASEVRVAKISKDIKDVEAEIKVVDGEIEIMKTKEKQLQEELSYKRKIVHEKEWEVQMLKRRYEIWKNMLDEQRIVLQTNNEELERLQQIVWDTRISFYDKTMEFLSKNDFLLNTNHLENIIENQREENKLKESICALESELTTIENRHDVIKGRYDLLNHLEKEKQILLDFEQSQDIIRIQSKITSYNKELESLDHKLAKYRGTAAINYDEIMLNRLKRCREDKESTPSRDKDLESQKNMEEIQDLAYSEKKQPFKPKVPSLLLRKPL